MAGKGHTAFVRNRIKEFPSGKPFVASDFSDITTMQDVRRILQRMTDSGDIRRLLNGIYIVPEWSSLLDEEVPPSPHDVACAIARNRGWTITPSGNTALNRLGLSTQVPSVWSYVSDGPYAEYEYGTTSIKFRHSANRNITGMSPLTGLVVQAIKALGKDGASPEDFAQVASRMREEERERLSAETQRSTAWIRKVVLEMTRMEA